MKIFILGKLFLLFVTLAIENVTGSGGANADQPEVQSILEEIGALIRQHYKIPERPVELNSESLPDVDDDVRYTVEEAKQMFLETKESLGYKLDDRKAKQALLPNPKYFDILDAPDLSTLSMDPLKPLRKMTLFEKAAGKHIERYQHNQINVASVPALI